METIKSSLDEIRALAVSLRDDDALDDPCDYLEHHGIKGMRWGVRNKETQQKYGLIQSVKDRHAKGSEIRAEQKANRKAEQEQYGMSKDKYDKLREKTLKSHDPREVSKGMHTLSDEELNRKISRLRLEGQMASMAEERSRQKANDLQRRYDAVKKNPLYELATDPIKEAARDTIKEVTKGVIVDQLYSSGAAPVLQKKVNIARDRVLGKNNPNGKSPFKSSDDDNKGSSKKKKKNRFNYADEANRYLEDL